jgi:hypothetical protein
MEIAAAAAEFSARLTFLVSHHELFYPEGGKSKSIFH